MQFEINLNLHAYTPTKDNNKKGILIDIHISSLPNLIFIVISKVVLDIFELKNVLSGSFAQVLNIIYFSTKRISLVVSIGKE